MAGNANFDSILSTTLNNYVPKLEDNVFTARPLFYALTKDKNIRRVDGGAKIVVPIIYGANAAAGSYSGTDTLSTTASTGITSAEFDWGQYAATITISGIEEAKNNGEAAIIDLLEGKIMQAEETIIENMNTMLHGNGTGNSGKDWNGLGNLVEAADDTVGGINNASGQGNDWWESYEENTDTALTLAHMRTAYNSVSVGNDQPDIQITTQTLYEKYESLLQPQLRYTDADTADAGFQNLVHKGAPVTFDAACPAEVMYFLNTKYLRLVGHSDVWFKPTPFVRPNSQDAVYSQILCYGQLTVSNRARQGKLTAKSAS